MYTVAPALRTSSAKEVSVRSEPLTVYPLSNRRRAMAERPLPPMPMKWTCVIWFFVSQFLRLDVHHKHKYKCNDDGKVDTGFTQQLRRHVEHHLVDRLQ